MLLGAAATALTLSTGAASAVDNDPSDGPGENLVQAAGTWIAQELPGEAAQAAAQLIPHTGEVPPPGLLDLPSVRTGRPVPLAVLRRTQRARDQQLLGQIRRDLRRHLPQVRHEPAQIPRARQLDREPEPVVRTPLGLHRLPVHVAQEEVSLRIRMGWRPVERPIPGCLSDRCPSPG